MVKPNHFILFGMKIKNERRFLISYLKVILNHMNTIAKVVPFVLWQQGSNYKNPALAPKQPKIPQLFQKQVTNCAV